jgi:bifunctional ADP-heptose synthase (sugar kinase/adenylyltransferase)
VVALDRPTTCKTRIVSGRQQFFRIDRELTSPLSVDVQAKLVAAARSAISQADVVVLSDYAKGTFDENVLIKLIGIAKSEGKLIPKGAPSRHTVAPTLSNQTPGSLRRQPASHAAPTRRLS